MEIVLIILAAFTTVYSAINVVNFKMHKLNKELWDLHLLEKHLFATQDREAKLKAALEFYAAHDHWAHTDHGRSARATLKKIYGDKGEG
jgi:hypothetical protein